MSGFIGFMGGFSGFMGAFRKFMGGFHQFMGGSSSHTKKVGEKQKFPTNLRTYLVIARYKNTAKCARETSTFGLNVLSP